MAAALRSSLRGSFRLGLAGCSVAALVACGGTGGADTGGLDGNLAMSGGAGKAGSAGKAGATTGKGGAGGATTGTGGASGGSGQAGGTVKGGAAGVGAAGGSSLGGSSAAGSAGVGANAGSSAAGKSGAGGAGTAGTGTAGASSAGAAGASGKGTAGTTGAGGASAGSGGSSPGCNPAGSATDPDQDKDGFTVAQGDCNDCDASVNPGAIDVIKVDAAGNPLPPDQQVDNDCDGKPATPAEFVCDDNFAVDDPDPFHGANAIELCQKATGAKWGVVSAQYQQIDGNPLPDPVGHGLLAGFGPNVKPQKGKRLLALSSGSARQPSDPGYQSVSGDDKGYTSNFPPGFPLESPACPGVTTGMPHDSAALKIDLKVPTNAKSFSFKFKFYTFEFPNWICSQFNDFFTVLMNPPPSDVNPTNKNITFDSMKNPVSVNNAFLEVCTAQSAGGKTFPCPAGVAELQGTGFEDHAGTVWLKTTANVTPGGAITLTFGAFDSGDGILDSTGLVDDFEWSATAGSGTVTGKP